MYHFAVHYEFVFNGGKNKEKNGKHASLARICELQHSPWPSMTENHHAEIQEFLNLLQKNRCKKSPRAKRNMGI
jgi:hypothetical protein